MKHEERITALKTQRPRPAHPPSEGRAWLPRWAKIVFTVSLSAIITYLLCDNVIFSRVPTTILGKWEVTEGELEGYTMHFFRNGSMRSQVITDGHVNTLLARVHVEDDMLETTFVVPEVGAAPSLWQRIVSVFMPESGAKVTVAQRIISLTPSQLVIEDEDGKLIKMERVR